MNGSIKYTASRLKMSATRQYHSDLCYALSKRKIFAAQLCGYDKYLYYLFYFYFLLPISVLIILNMVYNY